MPFPLKTEYNPGQPIASIPAGDLRTIANMLNGLKVTPEYGRRHAEVVPPNQDGQGWEIKIPAGSGSGLPSNAGKSKYMVPQLSADNATETDNPNLWTVDWLRAHA